MPKTRHRSADLIVFLVVRLLLCFLQALPLRLALALADGLAWLACRVDQRHRLVAQDNLRHAFAERAYPERIDRLLRAIYRHFCRLIVEIALVPRLLHLNNWQRYVELSDGRALVQGLLADRPLLLLTGHFGNWELGGYVLGLLGFRTYAVARPLDNPYLDDLLRQFRERTGQKLLAKKGDFEHMQALLASGGVLATLADQDAGQRGLFVDFFGRPASTHKAVALLALEYRVPLLVIGVRRICEPLRYRIVVEDAILPEDYAGQPNAIAAITQRFTTALERIIRAAPEQYLWLHRRWKHQPRSRRSRQVA